MSSKNGQSFTIHKEKMDKKDDQDCSGSNITTIYVICNLSSRENIHSI